MRENLHTHTTYCDGKDSMEDMIKEAIDKNFECIGFSSHLYSHTTKEYCMKEEDTLKYIKEASLLKEKYKDEIKIYCGIEADIFSDYDTSIFDYVIGSVHSVEKNGNFIEIDHICEDLKEGIRIFYGGDNVEFAKDYFKSVVRCVKKHNADIVGHLDLITKFNEREKIFDIENPEYIKSYRSAVEELVSMGKVFEINTGPMSRGYKTSPYPHFDILEYIAKLGGKVIITGDIHKKEMLGKCYDFALNYAKTAGIKNFVTSEDIIQTRTVK